LIKKIYKYLASHLEDAAWLRPATLILFLLIAVCLGGASRPGLEVHLVVQLLCCLVGLICLFVMRRNIVPRSVSWVLRFSLVAILWSCVQLIPLPEDIWSKLGDRSVLRSGLDVLGYDEQLSLPISLTPGDSFASILGFIPPLATFLLIYVLGWRTAVNSLSWLIPILAAVSVLIGLAQIFLGSDSGLYFYNVTNEGAAVGVFSNVNHNATLALMSIPFIAVLASEQRRSWRANSDGIPKIIFIFTLLIINIVGILATGSVAGYILSGLAIGFSLLIFQSGRQSQNYITPIGIGLGIGGCLSVLVFSSPFLSGLGNTSLFDGDNSRLAIWKVSWIMLQEHFVLGTGLGSFEEIYRLFEDPKTVTRTYINNAHNDVLQIAIEWGLPGMFLALATFVLILRQSIVQWFSKKADYYRVRRAASIALLLILLHSCVDYPLRTAGLACLSAACLTLLILPDAVHKKRTTGSSQEGVSQETKRVVI